MSIHSELSKFWRILSDAEYRAFRRDYKAYRRAHGKGTPAGYPGLLPGQTVLDIGGFRGDWTAMMVERYAVNAHIFELHPQFAAKLQKRFSENEAVCTHAFALGKDNMELSLSDDADASSVFVQSDATTTGAVRNLVEVFEELKLDRIGVAKINIEGGEYELLPTLIETAYIEKFDRITVQFHEFSEGDRKRRDDIRLALSQTHDCVWCYPFVWEEWHIKGLGT
ncbi:FkbM family methyltransferase [Shimia thalassica]|nr:FkbM family methyltransferase [Shimia thalassica]